MRILLQERLCRNEMIGDKNTSFEPARPFENMYADTFTFLSRASKLEDNLRWANRAELCFSALRGGKQKQLPVHVLV